MPSLNATAEADSSQPQWLLQRLAGGEPVSGDTLARECGQTRAAIWKRVEALRRAGARIEAERGLGYRLASRLSLLDAAALQAALPGTEVTVAWQTASTNTDLLQQTPPDHGCRVLLAESQTGGRGRLGRVWASPLAANLYLSLDRRYQRGLAGLAGLSLAVGVICAEAVEAATGVPLQLKWPNDLLFEGRKLGGILIEGGGEHAGPVRAVIGIGLNVAMPDTASDRIDQPWTDLSRAIGRRQDAPLDRTALAIALLQRLVAELAVFDEAGLAPFLERYRTRDALAGRDVTLHLPDGRVEAGVALGVASDGGLRIQHAGEERLWHAGEARIRLT